MTRKMKLIIIAILTIFSVVLVLFFVKRQPQKNSLGRNVHAYSSWDEYYELDSKEPNGLYHWNSILNLQIKGEIKAINYLYELDSVDVSHDNFIFVGRDFALFDEEIDSLLSKVERGANFFLAAERLDFRFKTRIFDKLVQRTVFDSKITINSGKEAYHFTHMDDGEELPTFWSIYNKIEGVGGLNIHETAQIEGMTSRLEMHYGAGTIYVEANPELFVNYHILSKDGFAYAKDWLEKVNPKGNVYWLEIARYDVESAFNYSDTTEKVGGEDSYLQYIFQNKIRTLAFALGMIGLLLFLIFRTRRTQPFSPIIPKKRNMSLIFAKTLSSIYYNDRNPQTLFTILKRNFYAIVKRNFGIDLTEHDSQEVARLAKKTGVNLADLKFILEQFKAYEQTQIVDSELVKLRMKLLEFYYHSGVINVRLLELLKKNETAISRNYVYTLIFFVVALISFFFGLYLLTKAIGMGVILLPLAVIFVVIASLRTLHPQVVYNDTEMTKIRLFGKKETILFSQLTNVINEGDQLKLTTADAKVSINLSDMRSTDRKSLVNYMNNISKFN